MNTRTIGGIILLLLGAFLFLNQGEDYGPGKLIALFWPSMFVLPLSILFHWLYFSVVGRKGVGLLVPAGVLLAVAIVCQVGMLFDNWQYIWPGFILAPALGLFELYWFGGRNKFLLIPVSILTVISALFFIIFSLGFLFSNLLTGQPIVAVFIILAGLLLMFYPKNKH